MNSTKILIPVFWFLIFSGAGELTAQGNGKYALLIGINNYQHAVFRDRTLMFAEADARSVGDLLKASGYRVEVIVGQHATSRKIREALDRAARQGATGGAVIIGMFGHGLQYGEDGYFCPYDTGVSKSFRIDGTVIRNSQGKPILEPDPRSMISMKEVFDSLNTCRASNRILLADCCRNDPSMPRERSPFGSALKVRDLPNGTAAIFACSRNEAATEHSDWGHGAFTYAFLKHTKNTKDGKVSIGSLVDQMYETVAKLVEDASRGRRTQSVYALTNGRVVIPVTHTSKTKLIDNSSPLDLSGKNPRVQLHAGDALQQGVTDFPKIDPTAPVLLDAPPQAEIEARFRAGLKKANANLHQAKQAFELANHNYSRARRLKEIQAISQSEFEAAEHRLHIASANLDSAGLEVRQFNAIADVDSAEVRAALYVMMVGEKLNRPQKEIRGHDLPKDNFYDPFFNDKKEKKPSSTKSSSKGSKTNDWGS